MAQNKVLCFLEANIVVASGLWGKLQHHWTAFSTLIHRALVTCEILVRLPLSSKFEK